MKITKRNVSWSRLSLRERSLLLFLASVPSASLAEMQANVFGDLGTGTSPVRNNLRRLVDCNLAAKVAHGVYAVTSKGLHRVPNSLLAEVSVLPGKVSLQASEASTRVARGSIAPPIAPPSLASVIRPVTLLPDSELAAMDRTQVELLLSTALKVVRAKGLEERRGTDRRAEERRGTDRRAN